MSVQARSLHLVFGLLTEGGVAGIGMKLITGVPAGNCASLDFLSCCRTRRQQHSILAAQRSRGLPRRLLMASQQQSRHSKLPAAYSCTMVWAVAGV